MGEKFLWTDHIFMRFRYNLPDNEYRFNLKKLEKAIKKYGADTVDSDGDKLIDLLSIDNIYYNYHDLVELIFKYEPNLIYEIQHEDRTIRVLQDSLTLFLIEICDDDHYPIRKIVNFKTFCVMFKSENIKITILQTPVLFSSKLHQNFYSYIKQFSFQVDNHFLYFLRNETIKTTSLSQIIFEKLKKY